MNEKTFGMLILFGSGETSPSGIAIHRKVLGIHSSKQKIAILETPAGFQPNSNIVAEEISNIYKNNLSEFVESVDIIPARMKGTKFSPDNHILLKALINSSLIFLGPGSPSYTVKQLSDTKALRIIEKRWAQGATLALSSAATLAFGKYTLPVYEIYKVGEQLHWMNGLNILSQSGLNVSIITHWNNNEGGQKLDTRYCFMGEERFNLLIKQLPKRAKILGIDENTALLFEFSKRLFTIIGLGNAYLLQGKKMIKYENKTVYEIDSILDFEVKKSSISYQRFLSPTKRIKNNRKKLIFDQLPENIRKLLTKRLLARKSGDFTTSDYLRQKIEKYGYELHDTIQGQEIYKTVSP